MFAKRLQKTPTQGWNETSLPQNTSETSNASDALLEPANESDALDGNLSDSLLA